MSAAVTSEKFIVKSSANPAADGSEISFTADRNLLVKTFHATLVTDGNAANRQVQFTFEDSSGNVYARFVAGGTQAATLTRNYSGRPGEFSAPAVADTTFIVPIPNGGVYLPAGGKIKTSTTSVQATDNWGAMTISARF